MNSLYELRPALCYTVTNTTEGYIPMTSISRRQFLGMSGAGLVGLMTGLKGARAAQPYRTRVHLHSFDPAATPAAQAVQDAMLAATDMSWLKPGDSVFVKLASNSNYPPPSVTSPDVLAGVVSVLQFAGAGTIYVGDMAGAYFCRHLADQTIGSTREVMRENGLLAAAEATGATVHVFDEVPFHQAYVTATNAGSWANDLQVAEILDRVDHIVNLPRLGKHVLAGASLGLKNAIGWVSDYSRMVLHRDGASFHQRIAEVNAIPQLRDKMRLTLTLVDKALTTYGPDAGYHLALNRPLIIASDDLASHDQVALMTLVWGRDRTPQDIVRGDPYPAESNGMNWYFVRVTWGADPIASYTDLPTFRDIADGGAMTHINQAFTLLNGARPDAIEVVPGGVALDEALVGVLTSKPELNIVMSA